MSAGTAVSDGYLSEAYYDTVIRSKPYRGWVAVFVGMGTMVFRNLSTGEEVRIDGPGELEPNGDRWMEVCWDEARRILQPDTSTESQ